MKIDKYASKLNGTTVFVKGYSASVRMHLLFTVPPRTTSELLRITVP